LSTIITLTEDPLVRSWLFADKGALISRISEKQKVILVCRKENLGDVTNFLNMYFINQELVSVVSLDKCDESKFHKLFGFLMRYSEKSDGNSRLRNLLYERKKITYIGLKFRNMINSLLSRLKISAVFLRWAYGLIPNNLYKDFLLQNNCNFLLCTSLTNFNYDAELLRVAKKLNIENIGSPRSWDNLVSHGLLRVIPDIFLSHSTYMTECAIKYQYLSLSRIIETGTSTYRALFLPIEGKKNTKISVAIGCVGPNSNPSEYKFISEFIPKATAIYPNLEITIIQHPRFKHPMGFDFNQTKETFFEFKNFESLKSYYATLKQFDLLLTSGSTIGLDALFVGTPVECYFIDLVITGYWESSSRYLSHRTHYKDFINKMNLTVHDSIDSIIKSIGELSDNRKIAPTVPTYFTGYPTRDFDSIIINAVNITS
jgi:hypothetical protein